MLRVVILSRYLLVETTTINSTGVFSGDGTVSGAGTLTYKGTTAFPTTGTVSSIARFDATDNALSITGTRSFGGAVQFYNNSASTRSITMGTAGSQTFIFNSTVTTSTDDAALTVDMNTWDPTVTIAGALTVGATTTFFCE